MRTLGYILSTLLAFFAGGALMFWYLAQTPEFFEPLLGSNPPPSLPVSAPALSSATSSGLLPEHETLLLPQSNELNEIIDILRSNFIESHALIASPLDAESVEQLFKENHGKIRLDSTSRHTPDRGVRPLTELLPGRVAYWRPRDFNDQELRRFLREWELWLDGGVAALIIDLRNFKDPNNYDGAAAAASLFLPPGSSLFSSSSLKTQQKIYSTELQPLDTPQDMPLLLLLNRHTRGAAEVLASILRTNSQAVLVGEASSGEGGLFTENRLKSGRFLRTATARIISTDGTDLLGTPVIPDIPVTDTSDEIVFRLAYQTGLNPLLLEQVEGTPGHLLIRQEENQEVVATAMPGHDQTLQAAWDIIQSILLPVP